jgi:hypothetical protein
VAAAWAQAKKSAVEANSATKDYSAVTDYLAP